MISPPRNIPAGYLPIPASRGRVFYAIDTDHLSFLMPAQDQPEQGIHYTIDACCRQVHWKSVTVRNGIIASSEQILNPAQVEATLFCALRLEEVAGFSEMPRSKRNTTLWYALRKVHFGDSMVAGAYRAMGFPPFVPHPEGVVLRGALAAIQASYAHTALPTEAPGDMGPSPCTTLANIVPIPEQYADTAQLVKILRLLACMPHTGQIAQRLHAQYPDLRDTLYAQVLSQDSWDCFHDPDARYALLAYASSRLAELSLALYVGATDPAESLALCNLAIQCIRLIEETGRDFDPGRRALVRAAFHLKQYQTVMEFSRANYDHDTYLLLYGRRPDLARQYLVDAARNTTWPSGTLYKALLAHGEWDVTQEYLERIRPNTKIYYLIDLLNDTHEHPIARLEMAEYLATRHIAEIAQCRADPEMPPLPPIGDDVEGAIARLGTLPPPEQYAATLAVLDRLIQTGHGRHAPGADPSFAHIFSRYPHQQFRRDLAALYRKHGCRHEADNLTTHIRMTQQALTESTLSTLLQEGNVALATRMVRGMDDESAVFSGYFVLASYHLEKSQMEIVHRLVAEAKATISRNVSEWKESAITRWLQLLESLVTDGPPNSKVPSTAGAITTSRSQLPTPAQNADICIVVRAILVKGAQHITGDDEALLRQYENCQDPLITDPLTIVRLYLEHGMRERAVAYLRRRLDSFNSDTTGPYIRVRYLEAVFALEEPDLLQNVIDRLLCNPLSNLDALLDIAERGTH